MHPLIRLRLKITAAERGAAYARKLGREDIAAKFDRAALMLEYAIKARRAAMAAPDPTTTSQQTIRFWEIGITERGGRQAPNRLPPPLMPA